ncbi:hypothetical protein Kpol_1024p17 [Vanderwaltozyma polyspora DSM 70294]|uniref:Phosducin thioredoxin-like domain-containing protein n=1 Tax=Vanderwaltozyma polyspora (strain ATCC 22028 / DSM 70294 / BCRC 21397 / CBS 2163 / NBRC 10782 / NRRL Y-8283 / UCD 57-17) TaxID=436907 RepID=A7TLH8_VANPO|nr:uncharacterized protein Kpol_1024p17 [Vanderwaltozyma polyspora DSM 70294]EDO16864.1 hypothetical protein Kpol_1024p17 [Vanderwaltozyma polyspora DSM 70294]
MEELEGKLLVTGSIDDDDIDQLIEELENEDGDEFSNKYREERIEAMVHHARTVERNVREGGYGSLQEIQNEKEVITMSTNTERIVISFGLDHFAKCQYMNEQLRKLSLKHLTTKFVYANVENCPFLVDRLSIKVLPFVVGYKKGVERLRIVGFSSLGNDPNEFQLDTLEKLLYSNGLLEQMTGISSSRSQKSWNRAGNDSEDSDLDLN